MSSVSARTRQNAPSHFMTVSSLAGLVYAYNPTAGTNTFTNATWASAGASYSAVGSPFLSTIAGPGGLLKDVGKNVVSANRYFRKVQLVLANSGPKPSTGASTFGIAGTNLGTYPNQDYLTGYSELGYEGGGAPAPVVQFGTL